MFVRHTYSKLPNNMKQTKQYEYVDLGLPSGLKWAKCNLGAEKETDYGNYYMWGSTEPNTADECIWEHAPFNDGSDSFEKRYFNAYKSEWLDDNDNLKPEYDAAYKATDGAARMPTQDECKELIDNTIKQWVDNYNDTGVSGRKITSKTNGNSIFIPAAGFCYDGSVDCVGGNGYVWSSSLDTLYPYVALNLYFDSDYCSMYSGYRYYGRSVRGVMD